MHITLQDTDQTDVTAAGRSVAEDEVQLSDHEVRHPNIDEPDAAAGVFCGGR